MRSLYTAMCGTEKIYPIPKVPPLVIHTPVDNSAASPSPIEDTVLRAATCRYATLCPFLRIAPRVQAVATLVVDEDRGVAGEHIVRVDVGDGEALNRGSRLVGGASRGSSSPVYGSVAHTISPTLMSLIDLVLSSASRTLATPAESCPTSAPQSRSS